MSKDLIKRSDVLSVLEKVFEKYNVNFGGNSLGFGSAVPDSIKSIPSVDIPQKPVKVNPSRVSNDRTDGCPICKREFYEKFNFCPDCGAKMDWGDNE